MTKWSISFTAGAAIFASFPAHSQQLSETPRSPDDEIIVVASGVAQPIDETGRSVSLIGREEIEARQAVAVSDLLSTVPGVGVTQSGGPGALTAVRIRGAEDAQTLVLIDGVRVNDPASPGAAFDFGNLLAGSVERVEVLRGPNSVAWGSQAIGGVVNVVTQTPIDGLSARASAEYGSFDQLSTTAALAAGNERLRGALTAGWFRTDGISQAAVGSETDGYEQFGTTGSITAALAPGLSADLRLYYAHSRLDLDGFPPPTYGFADTADYSETQEVYGYAGLNADTGPVRNRLSFTLADINRDNYEPAYGDAVSFFARGRSERYAYQGDADLGRARLVFGAERENSRFFDGGDVERQGITSVYGEAIVTPVAPLTLTLGARNDDHSGFGSHWTFGANAAVRPFDGTVLRASYGEGFKAPTLYQRFSAYGTPWLEPETAKSYELGVRQTLLSWLSLDAAWFHRDTEQQIDFDLSTFTYFNIARSRAEGVEVELVAQPVTGLSLRGSYSHVDAENRSEGANFGNALARRPQDSGALSADYRFGDGGPSIGGTLRIVGGSFDNAGNSVRLDGYTLAGIRAAAPLGDSVELYGRIENLFDEAYQVVSGYGTPGRSAFAGVRFRLR